jgi:hypothetical protein
MSGRTRAAIVVVVVCLALFGWFGLGHETPTGQPPLVELTTESMAALKADFNRAAGGTRIIALLSPT